MNVRERGATIYLEHQTFRRTLKPFLEYESVRRLLTGVRSKRIGRSEYEVTISGVTIKGGYYWMDCIRKEWPAWKLWYLPPGGLKGKTVLDVGSGCGESMLFFILNGAKRVIGIEMDPVAVEFCRKNIEANGWDATVINDEFRPEHQFIAHDFEKVDVEGGERALLDRRITGLPNCRIELHPNYSPKNQKESEALIQKFGLKRIQDNVWSTV